MSYGIKTAIGGVAVVGGVLLGLVMLSEFEAPPNTFIQRGYRGVAMGTNYNNKDLQTYLADNKVPASLPQLPAVGPKASQVYKNVQVLGDLSVVRLALPVGAGEVAPWVDCDTQADLQHARELA